MSAIINDALRYARITNSRISNSLDYYVWREMRGYYETRGVPVRGSTRANDVERMRADLYIEYMDLSSIDKGLLDREFKIQFPK